MPPTWLGYIGVDEVDASTEKLKSLGGSVPIEPTDIPNVGRYLARSAFIFGGVSVRHVG